MLRGVTIVQTSYYCLMRRAAGMDSLGAGIATGTSMSIILDEFITPALGFSAPNRAYPTPRICAASSATCFMAEPWLLQRRFFIGWRRARA